MTCKTCGRNSITGESQCGDCQPRQIQWPKDTWRTRRLAEIAAEKEGGEQQ